VRFENYFNLHAGRQVDKWQHYFPIYDRHLGPHQATAKRVLEIGIDHGGSLQIWKRFFPDAEIVGVDINPVCKRFEEDRISVCIGSQDDREFLSGLGEFDIVIDDGSHNLRDQEISFSALWPRTKSVYLIEDCHGPYPAIGGGLRYEYPWVVAIERPRRIIKGEPSRELRADEIEARKQYA
jgi:hypothetical protein